MAEIFREKPRIIRRIATNLLFVAIGVVFVAIISGAQAALAASLYFSPSAGNYLVGQSFSASVYVSSPDQAMNAASGVISFTSDKLEVVSLSKSGSTINFWVQEPSFQNGAGAVNFEGIVMNPGFKGQGGKIITVNFRVKSAGSGYLNFSSAATLANDGKGTNILDNAGTAEFNLNVAAVGPQASEATTASGVAGAPLAPRIYSLTHPNPEKWYSDKNPKFTWDLPDGVDQIRILYDKYPNSRPTVTYKPSINEKSLENIADGTWYFHAQFHNNNGWGSISHFRFQIDAQPPTPFKIKFIDGQETDNPRPTITVDHKDAVSGTAGHCDVKIDNGEWFVSNYEDKIEKPNQSHIFRLPSQGPGRHTIVVKASDKAGNYTVDSAEFVIKPIPAPVITNYPKEITEGDPLVIEGNSVPNSTITIFLKSGQNKALSQNIKSDKNGFFSLVWQIKEKDMEAAISGSIFDFRFKDGVYSLWAEAVDDRGALSERSAIQTLIIKKRPIETFLTTSLPYLVIIVSILAIILLMIYLIMNFWRKYVELHKRIKKESQEPEVAISEYFGVLLKNIRSYLLLLEGAKTRKELLQRKKKIIDQIKNDLDSIEVLILKEIKDLEERGK